MWVLVSYGWPILALLAAALMLGLQKSWQMTFGRMAVWLAKAIYNLPRIAVGPVKLSFDFLADALLAADKNVYAWIGEGIEHAMQPFNTFVRFMADVLTRPAQQAALFAADVLHTLTVFQIRVPQMIAAKVAWIPRHLATLDAKVAGLLTRAPVHIITKTVEVAKPTITNVIHKAIAVPLPRIGRLEREAEHTAKRIDKLARRVAPAALAALAVATLARVGISWTRCARTKAFGRGVCRMDDDYLGAFLAGSALIVSTLSIRELTQATLGAMDELSGGVRKIVRELHGVTPIDFEGYKGTVNGRT